MTQVAAAGASVHQTIDRPRAGAAPYAGRAFADMLLDQAHGDDARPFGGGTMRSSVEAFGAHGLFDGSVPLAAASDTGPVEPERVAEDGPDPVPPADTANPSEILDPSGPGVPDRTATVATRSVRSDTMQSRPRTAALARQGDPFRGQPSAVGTIGVDEEAEPAIPARAPKPRVRARETAATLSVSLTPEETGVAVSVIGDVRETPLHHAVARLLARYGLALSSMRVMHTSSAQRRQQETS